MKKVLALIFAVALTATVFTACKKDWTCTCTDSVSGSTPYPFSNLSKKDAQSACDTYNSVEVLIGGSCTLN